MTKDTVKRVNALLGTSCDDLKSSLQFVHDEFILGAALHEAARRNLTTKVGLIMARRRQLRKEKAA